MSAGIEQEVAPDQINQLLGRVSGNEPIEASAKAISSRCGAVSSPDANAFENCCGHPSR